MFLLFAFSGAQDVFQVSHETEEVTDFVWSPDGRQFAYTALDNGVSKLYRIDMDGSNKFMLSSNAHQDIDWKNNTIVFMANDPAATAPYNSLIKTIKPDGSGEATIIGPYWYGSIRLDTDANWVLYERAPTGWWQAMRCDLEGGNELQVSHSSLVQQVGWLGNNHILYTRGTNFDTPCGIHKVNHDGSGRIQLTPETLPNNATFSASPDAGRILYCNGANWDIWIMDTQGDHKTQLTDNPAKDYLSNTRDNIWSADSKSFYFVSERSGMGDIYRLNADGSGLTQITQHDSLDYQPVLSPDGMKLAFISKRDGAKNIWMLFLQPFITSITDVPNDQGGKVSLVWRAASVGSDNDNISHYSIWRALPSASLPKMAFTNQQDIRKDFSGTAYILKSLNGDDYAWEWLANQPAHGFSTYSYAAATLYDSMSTSDGIHYFLVSAHAIVPGVFYDSNVESGYSVDNLAPLPPEGFIASVVDQTVELTWDESPAADFHSYTLYRNGTRYAISTVNFYQDQDVEIGQSYTYRVTASDVHENESAFSEALNVTLTSIGERGPGLPLDYQLGQNYPNPFNPKTEIRYSLPVKDHVELSIYSLLGQRIAILVSAEQPAGYYQVQWDGTDHTGNPVVSGIYLYELRTRDFVLSRKMLLVK